MKIKVTAKIEFRSASSGGFTWESYGSDMVAIFYMVNKFENWDNFITAASRALNVSECTFTFFMLPHARSCFDVLASVLGVFAWAPHALRRRKNGPGLKFMTLHMETDLIKLNLLGNLLPALQSDS